MSGIIIRPKAIKYKINIICYLFSLFANLTIESSLAIKPSY